MTAALLECVVNVSEGRRPDVVARIRDGARAAAVLDVHSDTDHDRSVLTLAGPPERLVDAVVGLARTALELVDLRSHTGLHPRLGVVDVVPFVPLRTATMADAVAAAVRCAERLWTELGIPSFLYEAAARSSARAALPRVRAGAFTVLAPDVGDPGPHPAAGAAVVGARELLVAYNLTLRGGDAATARRVAARVRERDGGLPHLRAIGRFLPTPGLAQVSMNLVRPASTTMADAHDAVRAAALAEGTAVLGGELVGLAPRAALGGRDPASLGLRMPPKILEDEIARLP